MHLRFHEIFLKLAIKFYECFIRQFFVRTLYLGDNNFYVKLASKILQNWAYYLYGGM